MTFEIRAIAPDVLDQLRKTDDAGRTPRRIVEEEGGSPLRCCLRRSRPGEAILLVAYAPLRRWALDTGADPGAYEEVGPVFIHEEPCEGPQPETGPGYPAAMGGPRRVFRTYRADGSILDGHLVGAHRSADPVAASALLDTLLEDPEAALVHVRAVEFGCFLFEVRRGGPGNPAPVR
ncbi:DUF1203 domain-containing protein [Microbispora sp. SCL1-1]|uniref:DUF1203 domain-containing protein n=1 Tax=unclassified Microbispora TaxID=2614687 RepID=UPI0011583BC4|nr:DUF1203 domain-containing protein [Microbispora sp. SCL1-1]NJP24657.1 DUF1203 domain-containing protein [Microbispora sp. CL1-1]TQS14780.1 DUF1203 domain-containing protein [Microbispora sp. SCL1-1]